MSAVEAQPAKGYPPTGVGYVGQIEHEYMSLHKLSVCANCLALGFQKPLKRCNGCRLVDYCSKECQKQHWSKHKAFCNMVQGKGLKNGYLSKFKTPEEVFKILIDSYRLRVELDHAHRDENHGIYYDGKLDDNLVWAHGDASDDFQRYLDLTEEAGVLPEWWRFENRMECLTEAVDKKNEESIFTPIDQENLVTKYEGNISIRNALNILAELIVGYEGKGRAEEGKWFAEFQEYLDLHPEEKARLIAGTVEAVKNAGIIPAKNSSSQSLYSLERPECRPTLDSPRSTNQLRRRIEFYIKPRKTSRSVGPHAAISAQKPVGSPARPVYSELSEISNSQPCETSNDALGNSNLLKDNEEKLHLQKKLAKNITPNREPGQVSAEAAVETETSKADKHLEPRKNGMNVSDRGIQDWFESEEEQDENRTDSDDDRFDNMSQRSIGYADDGNSFVIEMSGLSNENGNADYNPSDHRSPADDHEYGYGPEFMEELDMEIKELNDWS